MTFTKRVILFLIRLVCKVLLSVEVRGQGNVPHSGSLVLVSNHIHNIDVFLLPFSFPRWINFMAKQELFNNPMLVYYAMGWGFPNSSAGRHWRKAGNDEASQVNSGKWRSAGYVSRGEEKQ